MEKTHHILLVPVTVKPECIREFTLAANENAAQSRLEPGVVRFEILQNQEDETRFTLLEVYHSALGHQQHQQTPHYHAFREKIPALLQKPYQRELYTFTSSAL